MGETGTSNEQPRPSDTRQCRICLAGAEEEPELGRLIKPCHCKGSMRYVHVKCLDTWRKTSRNSSSFWSCPQCKFKYSLARTKIVGLSTSPFVKVPTTIVFFILLVFGSSFIVSGLLPYLDNPAIPVPAINRINQPQAIYEYGFGWSFNPFSFIPEFVKEAIHTVAEISAPEGVDERYARYRRAQRTRVRTRTRDGSRKDWGTMLRESFFGENLRDRRNNNPIPPVNLDDGGPPATLWERLIRRFVLGLSLVGILSFLNLLATMSLFGPLQIARARFVRQNNRQEALVDIATITVVLFVIVGVVRAIYGSYKFTGVIANYLLKKTENAILEVQDSDDEDEEPSKPQAGKRPEPSNNDSGPSSGQGPAPRAARLRHRVRVPQAGDDFGDELPATPGAWQEEWNW